MSGPPPVPGRRSDGEREAARRERAARRAGIDPSTPAGRAAADGANGTRRGRRPPRTSLTVRGRVVLAALVVAIVVVAWFMWSLFQPFHGDGEGRVVVTIPRNAGVGEIAEVLDQKGVISKPWFFQARARISGRSGDLKPGIYTLKRDMSYVAALDALAKGPPPDVVSLILPEGKSRREIAPSIKSLEGDYLAATRRSRLLDPADYGADGARDLEGFLFPATYQLRRGQSVQALVDRQLSAFKKRFATVDLRAAKRKNLTAYDVLIIASLVERETAVQSERRLIAGVIYNRLSKGIPLGIDATTRFQYNDWKNPLRQSQLQSSSPYNTRLNKGLPPGPIGSPGISSIQAAANPTSTGYLYYVANPCKPGTHTFVRTGGEFDAAVAKYNAAREAAGGRAPQGC